MHSYVLMLLSYGLVSLVENKLKCCFILQDLLVDRLTQTVDRLREEIDMFETQCSAQLEETKAAQKSLSEATTEIEVSIITLLYVHLSVIYCYKDSLRFFLTPFS